MIPTLLDVGGDLAGRNHHYVRDFVDGSTLELLVANRALDLRKAIHILWEIASAVQRMHALKIAHCNMRSDRILVGSDGVPKLIGFGNVWSLAGDDRVPPGMSGVSAEVDVRALQETLAWLYARFDQSIPTALEACQQQGSALTAGRFAEALSSYLKAR